MKKSYLLEPQHIFEKVNHAVADTVYIFDLEDKALVWLSDRAHEMTGYALEDLKQMGPSYVETIMHPDDLHILYAAIANVDKLEDDKPLILEYRLQNKNGHSTWVHDRVTVFSRKPTGEVESVIGIVTDVNELKERGSQLETIIQKLNLSLSAAKMGIWEWDIEKNTIIWDERMYHIHGVDPKTEMAPIDIVWKYANREDMELSNIRTREAVEKKQDFYVAYRTKFPNDEIHYIRSYGRFVDSENNQRMHGVCWDSTEEALTEKEVAEAKARLISSTKMAALGEMSGGIAHEINNPLTVIQARAFQLTQMVEADKLDPAKVKQAAESISRTADKIAKIIKSLRSFAREGSFDPFELVPVKQLVEETLEFCRTRFYNHGVEIEVAEIDPELEVECRIIQVEQVLLNLLNNSFDAIQNLENRWIRVSVRDTEEHIELTVSDSGLGISSDLQDQIMLPFFTTKEVGKGTGLGLSISAGIMKNHKGSLKLDTSSEHTTFVATLPKWQDPEILE